MPPRKKTPPPPVVGHGGSAGASGPLQTVNQEFESTIEDLKNANSDLENLISSTNIATVLLDRRLRIKRFTPAAVGLFNLIPGDVGRPLADLRHRLDYPAMAADAGTVVDRLEVVEREVRAGDGNWYFSRMLPYRTTDDRVAGAVLTFVDITERKSAQEGWADSDARFQAIFGQATAGIAFTDLAGCFSFVNHRFCEVVGYASQELVGTRMLDLVHPDDRARDEAHLTRLHTEGLPFDIEKRYVRKDGALRWVHNSVSLLRDLEGRPQTCFAVSIDITGRKADDDELRALKDRLAGDLDATTRLYNLIFNSAADFGIYTLDQGGLVTSFNPGAEAISLYRAEEVVGQSAKMFHTREDQDSGAFEEDLARALRKGHAICERWKVRRDGSEYWGSGALTPLVDDGRTVGFLKIERDTTAQRQAQETRREIEEERARLLVAERHARQLAEGASAAKDRFLAALSHELRTPLAPMQMAVYALERERRLSAAGRELLQMIDRNLDAEVRLIDDLLDVSRIVHGKMEFRRAPMDVHACVEQAVEACGGDIGTKKQRLTVELAAADATLQGDPDRLRQVFCNLIQNATKFTPAAGAVDVRSSNPAPDELLVEITDTGIGIEPAALEKIFSAFEQQDAAVTQRFGGLGLGLAICDAVVTAHGGRIMARSPGKDRGATFAVMLPLAPAAEN